MASSDICATECIGNHNVFYAQQLPFSKINDQEFLCIVGNADNVFSRIFETEVKFDLLSGDKYLHNMERDHMVVISYGRQT